jgi:hypothetical protein
MCVPVSHLLIVLLPYSCTSWHESRVVLSDFYFCHRCGSHFDKRGEWSFTHQLKSVINLTLLVHDSNLLCRTHAYSSWDFPPPPFWRMWVDLSHLIFNFAATRSRYRMDCGLDSQGSILISAVFSSSLHADRLWGPSSLLSNGYQGLFPLEKSCRGTKLTACFYPMLRSRKVELYLHSPMSSRHST